jgi:hypothetical protein
LWLPTGDDHASLRRPFERLRTTGQGSRRRSRFWSCTTNTAWNWGQRSINYLLPELLWHVFEELEERVQIVYLRPGILGELFGYSGDHQPELAFGDLEVVRQFSDVWLFDERVRDQTARHIMS